MTWHIILQDKQAYSFACDLLRMDDLEIITIENHQGETIDLDEVTLAKAATPKGRV